MKKFILILAIGFVGILSPVSSISAAGGDTGMEPENSTNETTTVSSFDAASYKTKNVDPAKSSAENEKKSAQSALDGISQEKKDLPFAKKAQENFKTADKLFSEAVGLENSQSETGLKDALQKFQSAENIFSTIADSVDTTSFENALNEALYWQEKTKALGNPIPEMNEIAEDFMNKAIDAENADDLLLATDNYWAASEQYKKMFEAVDKHLRLLKDNYDPILTDKNLVVKSAALNAGGLYSANESKFAAIFREGIVKTINRVLGVVAIIYLIVLGIKLILARGNDDEIAKYKTQFGFILLGLALISVAEFAGFEIFDPSSGKDILRGNAASNMATKIREIVNYLEYIVTGIMLIIGVITGYTMIVSGEKDETITNEKRFVRSFLLGAMFILMAETIARIFGGKYGTETYDVVVTEVSGIVNFILTFIAAAATFMLILASLYYIISFGSDDQMNRAKRTIYVCIFGIVMAFSSYVIASFLIK